MQSISSRLLQAEQREMASIRHFRVLDLYQLAMKTPMILLELSKAFPLEERYSLTDQVRRSSRSFAPILPKRGARGDTRILLSVD